MRILSRYIRDDFLLTFLLTLLVLTFVMSVMVLFRISDPLAMGGSAVLIWIIFLCGLPSALGFAIPASIITAGLLTFGRLSANGEITAMKSGGIRMLQIIRQPMLYSLLLSALCFYLNAEVIPVTYEARREALRNLGTETPMELIEEGRFIRDFPGFTFYFGAKNGSRISDVIIYQSEKGKPTRTIRAMRGVVRTSEDKSTLRIDLFDVRIDPFYDDKPGPGTCSEFPLIIDLKRAGPRKTDAKKKSDMTLLELQNNIANAAAKYPELDQEKLAWQQSALRVELHKRIVLSIACFAFVLLGIPLATKTHRKESSVGIGISLILVFFFYLFVIAAESLTKHPSLHPHLIVWIPAVLAIGLGAYLVHRCD